MDGRHNLRPGSDVQSLVPDLGSRDVALTPETEVLCIHRGRDDYEDMYDSRPYRIAPGYFKTTLAAAMHFRARAVVPGSRNPETRRQSSFIVIIGAVDFKGDGSFDVIKPVDKPEEWAAFSDDEVAEYAGAQEALDRGGMQNAIDPSVTIVSTSSAQAGTVPGKASRIRGGGNVSVRPAGGSGKRSGQTVDQQVTDPEVMRPIPADENPVVREARAAAGQAQAEGHKPR